MHCERICFIKATDCESLILIGSAMFGACFNLLKRVGLM